MDSPPLASLAGASAALASAAGGSTRRRLRPRGLGSRLPRGPAPTSASAASGSRLSRRVTVGREPPELRPLYLDSRAALSALRAAPPRPLPTGAEVSSARSGSRALLAGTCTSSVVKLDFGRLSGAHLGRFCWTLTHVATPESGEALSVELRNGRKTGFVGGGARSIALEQGSGSNHRKWRRQGCDHCGARGTLESRGEAFSEGALRMELSNVEQRILDRFYERSRMAGGPRPGYMLRGDAVTVPCWGSPRPRLRRAVLSSLVEKGLLLTSESGNALLPLGRGL